jgi:hypothetical protein
MVYAGADHVTAYAMEIPIRPYTHNELRILYGVSWRTMKRWLKPFEEEIGAKNGHFYSVRQVKIIFRCLGMPSAKVAKLKKKVSHL